MPQYFHFHSKEYNGIQFDGKLTSEQCVHRHATGHRCKNKTVMSLDRCWVHVRKDYHVKIAPSSVPDAGRGLFAFNGTNRNSNDVVFANGVRLFPYLGEIITKDTLEERYGTVEDDHTAPYVIELTKKSGQYEDAALHRGIGSLINHGTRRQSNCRFSVTRNNRIMVVTTKKIRNGEELRINYNGNGNSGSRYQINEDGIKTSTNNKKYKAGCPSPGTRSVRRGLL